jgi:hypothetical protein
MNCETCGLRGISYPSAIRHLEKRHLLSFEDETDVDGINIQIQLDKDVKQ